MFVLLQLAEASEPKAETLQQLADLVRARRNLLDFQDALRKAAREYFEDAANSMCRSIETLVEDIAGPDTRVAARLRSDEGLSRRSDIIRSVPGCGAVTTDRIGTSAGARCLDSEPKAIRQACRMDSPDPAELCRPLCLPLGRLDGNMSP